MGPDPALTPDLIQGQSFTGGFRGYDQSEVRSFLSRVASEVRALRERVTQLEAAWRSAEERAARPPSFDEDTLMSAVGEETMAILRTARSAAAELRTKAGEDSDRIRAEAQEVLGRETTVAQETAGKIVEAARAEAADLVTKARSDADSIRAQADQERMLTIEGANATRDRILEDLSRRRRVATVQIEQLRAGRERLIESYAIVRRTLEEAQHELGRADAEARAAADEVGRRLRAEHAQAEAVQADEAQADEARADEAQAGPVEEPPEAVEAASEPVQAGDPARIPGDVPAAPDAPAPSGGAPVAVAEPFPYRDEADTEPRNGRLRRRNRVKTPNGVHMADPPPPPPAAAAPEGPSAEPQVSAPPTPESHLKLVTDDDAGAEDPSASQSVGDLFARIRAGQPEDAGPEEAEAEAADAAAADETDDSPDRPVADADEALLQQREAVVVELEAALTRKLKRALQDEQNDLLDRLRGIRGEATAARLLPDLDEQVSRYSLAAQPIVDQAVVAGAAFAAGLLGPAGKVNGKGAGLDQAGPVAADTGKSIVDPLRRRLEQAIHSSEGEDMAVMIESIGAAYREWKSQRIERIAGDALAAAFGRGTWHALPAGTAVRWVVEDVDGPCPDCDDDALAGALPKGEPFPTGQHHPPAHTGCRCLLVPTAPA